MKSQRDKSFRADVPLPPLWFLCAVLAGGAFAVLFWLVCVLAFSFGDEGRCITAAYRIDHQAACPEVQP